MAVADGSEAEDRHEEQDTQPTQRRHATTHHYLMFAINMALSLIVMYIVMFSMIDGWADFRNNLNTFYMALTMVAPMGIIMLATMGGMYKNKGLNIALYLGLAPSSSRRLREPASRPGSTTISSSPR